MSPALPEPLLQGRRALDAVSGAQILADWQFFEEHRRWALSLRLKIGAAPGDIVPPESDWFVLAEPIYPWGAIKFHPAKSGGIDKTFQHQSNNAVGDADRPWRDGDICLDSSVHSLRRQDWDVEPYGTHDRLRWRTLRALEWLRLAAKNVLVREGDPFELPAFPADAPISAVAFDEGASSYSVWQSVSAQAGMVELVELPGATKVYVIKSFKTMNGLEVYSPEWGRVIRELADAQRGLWFRLPSVPVLPPWQAPATWGELQQACRGFDLLSVLCDGAPTIRDGEHHVAVVGFPIPEKVGGPMVRMHWQAIELPIVSHGTISARGFRPKKGYAVRDRRLVFAPKQAIPWADSQCWNPQERTARGRLDDRFDKVNLLLLGAGALGSPVAELLVRAGLRHLTIVDDDNLECGNLSRHVLDMEDLGRNKAEALASRLNSLSPHAEVGTLPGRFPPKDADDVDLVAVHNLVLDCTADDSVLPFLESFPWGGTKLFVSLSLGFFGQRLYCFCCDGDTFPTAMFRELVRPWLVQDRERYADHPLPRDGVGCWHPLFPARADDVSMFAAVAVKQLESFVRDPPTEPVLAVFEQIATDRGFIGVKHVDTADAGGNGL